MALNIADNFKYQGKKSNFERDSFATKAAMKAFSETDIDEGHIAYCAEDGKHYVYNTNNPVDGATGKWKLYLGDYALTNEVTKKVEAERQERLKGITEYNVSVQHPTSGIGGTNKYTLDTAITKIPANLRYVGIKCSFVANTPNNPNLPCEVYQFIGASTTEFMDVSKWAQVGALSEQFEQLRTDLYSLNPQKLGYATAMGLELKERPTICGYPMTVISKGVPDFTPDFVGQMYIDTKNGKIYVSTNADNAGGFKVLN